MPHSSHFFFVSSAMAANAIGMYAWIGTIFLEIRLGLPQAFGLVDLRPNLTFWLFIVPVQAIFMAFATPKRPEPVIDDWLDWDLNGKKMSEAISSGRPVRE